MGKKQAVFFLTLVTAVLLLSFPSLIYADTTDLSTVFSLAGDERTLSYYLSPLIKTSLIGAGVISVVLVIGAGLVMIAGAGNTKKDEQSKGAATAGVMGLALVFSAYWIVRLVEVLTGINILSSGL